MTKENSSSEIPKKNKNKNKNKITYEFCLAQVTASNF